MNSLPLVRKRSSGYCARILQVFTERLRTFALEIGKRTLCEGHEPPFYALNFSKILIEVIDTKTIRKMSEEFLEGTPGFVVDVHVAVGNVIRISLDNDNRTSIEDCMALSRHIEGSFDREEEDFSLDVGSPGLDQPIKVLRQYKKLIGKQVMVLPKVGKKIEGELISIEDSEGEMSSLVLKTREKKRIEGRKAKQWVEEEHTFNASELEWTKVIISFK